MSDRINDRYIAGFFGMDPKENGEDISDIRSRLKRMIFANNEDICTIDGEPDGMFFIESGAVQVLDGDDNQLNVLHVGQYFGEYAVLSGEKRLSTVRSIGRTVVYKMESEDLLYFLSTHPHIYGEFMKRVYSQVSNKHSQVVALSHSRRGVLNYPANLTPMSVKQMILQYGLLAVLYIAALLFIPTNAGIPLFILPLALMLIYVLITKRTVESLVASGILAAILVYRTGVFAGFADSLMDTMGQRDNVFTVLVMALMGGMVNLIVSAGGVTAFEKSAAKYSGTERGLYFTSLGIMALTSIDDGLNMLTASYASHTPAKTGGIVRERLALFYSMLPTVLCSFLPISLWGIFVTGTMAATVKDGATELFVKSIPYNFFSLITLAAMVLFAMGRLPAVKQLKEADKRYTDTGALWPKGSERYLSIRDREVWGRKTNVILPIIVMAVSSVAVRSAFEGSLMTDSAVGLLVALAFMFILYCVEKVMTPERFMECLVDGISDSTLPIILYLLTINLSSMLDVLGLHTWLASLVSDVFRAAVVLLPAVVFLMSMLLTVAMGSSWSMYAIMFPIALNLALHLEISPALIAGAIAGAGIAGEKNCAFTAEAVNIAHAVGISPDAARKVRISYSIILTSIAAFGYLIAGMIMV